MSGKSFELFSIELQNDIALFQAVHCDKSGKKTVKFTYEQSRMFATVRKRNTLLFEQMSKITGKDYYSQSGDTVTDLQYEVIMVNFRWKKRGDTPYYIPNDTADTAVILDDQELRDLVYRDGFTITGIPGSNGGKKNIVYKPFVSSASMAREEKYLFVRQDRIKKLMERLSLGLVTYGKEGTKPVPEVTDPNTQASQEDVDPSQAMADAAGEKEPAGENNEKTERDHFRIQGLKDSDDEHARLSVAKLAAYLGLTLSDGSSIKELRDEFEHEYGGESDTLNLIDLNLDERSVVCVPSYDDFEIPFDKLGPYVWKSTAWHAEDKYEIPKFSGSIPDAEKMEALSGFFASLSNAANQNDEQNVINSLRGNEGKLAIDAWKELLKTHLYDDLQKLAGSDLPMRDLSQKVDSDEELCYRAYTLAFALNYERLHQTGYSENKKPIYDISGFTPRINGYTQILVDKDTFGQENMLFYAAIDELRENSSIDAAVNTLVNIAGKWKNSYLEISLENDTNPGDATANSSKKRLDFKLYNDSDLMGAKLTVPTKDDRKAELYDGIGFCDNEYFDKIERLLLCQKDLNESRYNALIIRLPFVKGLLLRMDFLKYFEGKGKIPTDLKTTAEIEDVFKIPRKLYNADGTPIVHVMLTRSMFKIYQLWKLLDPKPEDPWQEYWKRIKDNDFKLLITQRNTPPRKTSRLNYQFLTTLGLKEEEINKLVDRTFHHIKRGIEDPSGLLKGLAESAMPEEEEYSDPFSQDIDEAGNSGTSGVDEPSNTEKGEDDPDNIEDTGAAAEAGAPDETDFEEEIGSALLAACEKNKELYNTRYIRNMVHDRSWGSFIDAMYGRLEVDGDIRLLVPDLMATLDHIGDKFVTYKNKKEGTPEFISYINGVGSKASSVTWGHGYYYAPGDDAPWKTNTGHKEVCVLRNPHFAVGEDALLKPLDNDRWKKYDEWFGHLTGTVFLPVSAFLTINGADSDGDMGNVCCEYSVVEAVKRTAENNVNMLKKILDRRAAIIEKLKSLQESNKNKNSVGLLLSWFRNSIQVSAGEDGFIEGYCPAIVYAGSGIGVAKERPSYLNVFEASSQMTNLEKRFWDVFTLTSEAAIGLKSIQALSLAGVAYPCKFNADDDDMTLLGKWLSHYRVVNCGLDTANAIDNAKTNRRYKTLCIGQADPAIDVIVNLREEGTSFKGTSFKDFRTKSKRKLKDPKVHKKKNYKQVFGEIFEQVRTQKDEFVLDWLPADIFKRSQTLPTVQRYQRWKSYPGDPVKELADMFTETEEAQKVPAAQTDNGQQKGDSEIETEIEKELKKLVRDYSNGITTRNKARTQRDTLRQHYERIVRLLIYNAPLTEVNKKMELLLGDGTYDNSFIGSCFKNDNPQARLKSIHKKLHDEIRLSQIAWSSKESRKYLLENEVFPSGLKPGSDKADNYDKVMAMLTDTEQGVYLLKSVVRYLLEVVDMTQPEEQAKAVARTPKGLRRKMEEAIKKHKPEAKPEEVTEIFCKNCIRMVKKGDLSDFLFVELMGNELSKYVCE